MTRRIRSHKGGRTARAPEARMTPQERDKLDMVLEQRGGKYVDWLVEHVEADYKQITQGDDTMAEELVGVKRHQHDGKHYTAAIRARGNGSK